MGKQKEREKETQKGKEMKRKQEVVISSFRQLQLAEQDVGPRRNRTIAANSKSRTTGLAEHTVVEEKEKDKEIKKRVQSARGKTSDVRRATVGTIFPCFSRVEEDVTVLILKKEGKKRERKKERKKE